MTPTLLTRIEAAEQPSRELFLDVARALWGASPDSAEIEKWDDEADVANWRRWHRLHRLLSVEAFEQAALLLVPAGWTTAQLWEAANLKDRPWFGCALRRDEPYAVVKSLGAQTEATARLAAILRASEVT